MKTTMAFLILTLIGNEIRAQESLPEKGLRFTNPASNTEVTIAAGSRVKIWFKKPVLTLYREVLSFDDSSLLIGIKQEPYKQIVPIDNIARLEVKSVPQTSPVADKRSSMGFSVGYGFPSGSQQIAESFSSTSMATSSSYTRKGIYGSYGAGVHFDASYARMFSKNVGLDVTLSYLIGKTYTGVSSVTSGSGNFSSDETNSFSRAFLFSPSLILQTGEGRMRPYVKAGFILGSIKVTNEEKTSLTIPTGKFSSIRKNEFTGNLSFGLRAGAGVEFNIDKRMNFFTEVTFASMSYFPTNGTITEYSINGDDKLSTLPVSTKSSHFTREISTSVATAPDPSKPSENIQFSFPMGSVGVSVGVRIRLDKASAK